MTHDELREIARKQPFEPFRIVLSTGDVFDIRHPDLIMVGRRSAVLGITNQEEATVYDRTYQVDLRHIVGIQNLPQPSPPEKGNGQERQP
jgi:hypothetical protein